MDQTILIVEDEADLVEVMRYNLERERFRVEAVGTGEEAFEVTRTIQPDLVLLDIMLPGQDGLAVCRQLKGSAETAAIPVIMISAKGEEADIVVGLELGADDYMTKPFSPRVLVARVRARLRKVAPATEVSATLSIGSLVLDRARYVVLAGGDPLDLTKTEFELLEFLARHSGRVFTRNQLLDAVRGEAVIVTDRTIDTHVASLRRKMGSEAKRIVTVRGIGYRLEDGD